jgi:hypothetical protein
MSDDATRPPPLLSSGDLLFGLLCYGWMWSA